MLEIISSLRGIASPLGQSGSGGFDIAAIPNLQAWFAADDLATLWQDSGAVTPVSAVAQAVGFAGDKSRGFTFGPNLIANGDFAVDTAGWSVGTGYTLTRNASAQAVISRAGTTTPANGPFQNSVLVPGSFYRLSLDIISRSHSVSGYMGAFGADQEALFTATGNHQSRIVRAVGGTGFIIASTGGTLATCTVDNIRVQLIAGNHAVQSSPSFRPIFREASGVGYLDFDGLDDRLVGTALCGAGDNSLAVKTTVPASLPATQVIAGLSEASAGRFFIAVNTSGFLCAGVGNDTAATIVGSTDIRGQTGVAMLVEEGSTVTLYWNGTVQWTGPLNGAPSTAQPFHYGALNSNGTSGSFFNGDIFAAISAQHALTAAERAGLIQTWS